jgi:hypothetical protein
MSCASLSSARPAIRRACSSEVRGSLVLWLSAQSVARVVGVPNGHGPAEAIAMLARVTTDQKGAIAEAAIALAAIRLNVQVYKPMAEGGRCDLILGIGHELIRVQCKWSSLVNDVVVVPRLDLPTYARGLPHDYVHGCRCGRHRGVLRCTRSLLSHTDRTSSRPSDACFAGRSHSEQPGRADQLGGRFRPRGYTSTAPRGRSSVGRAIGWQPIGHGFESRRLHRLVASA